LKSEKVVVVVVVVVVNKMPLTIPLKQLFNPNSGGQQSRAERSGADGSRNFKMEET
jgi:hypothetical protein